MNAYIGDFLPSWAGAATWFTVMTFATAAQHMIGTFDNVVEFLVIAMVIDYITGVLAAYIDPNSQLSSSKGLKGISRKVMIVALVVVAHYCDVSLGQDTVVRNMTCWFFIGNEGLSILENAAKAGLPIPPKLKDSLAAIAQKGDKHHGNS